VLISNQSGTESYESLNNSNTFTIDLSLCPTGDDTSILVSPALNYSLKSEIFVDDMLVQQNITNYIFLSQTSEGRSGMNITLWNSTERFEYYPSYDIDGDIITILGNAINDSYNQANISYRHNEYGSRIYYRDIIPTGAYILNAYLPPVDVKQLYIIQVIDGYEGPVNDAKVMINRSVNGSFVTVSELLTSGYGTCEVELISGEQYKVYITADDYISNTFDYMPDPDLYGIEYPKVFQLQSSITEPITEYFWDLIQFNATLFANNTIRIRYNDLDSNTINATFHTIETYNYTDFLNATNTTTSNSATFWVTNINTSRTHWVTIHLNHTTLGYVIETIIVYPMYVTDDTLLARIQAVFGRYDLVNIVLVLLVYVPAIVLLVLFHKKHPGIGVIGAGLWIAFANLRWSIPMELNTLTPLIIVIGFVLIFVKGGKEKV